MALAFGPRRGIYIDIGDELKKGDKPLSDEQLVSFEKFDRIYRSLCALMYNYVPMSGHPGGSISSGRFVAGIMFDTADYDLSDPLRDDAGMISYAAGHKALGLYALWALRNEFARAGAPDLLPKDEKLQLRLEDLLGFRRNPTSTAPLFNKLNAKALDGPPTPATPFVKLSTGAFPSSPLKTESKTAILLLYTPSSPPVEFALARLLATMLIRSLSASRALELICAPGIKFIAIL